MMRTEKTIFDKKGRIYETKEVVALRCYICCPVTGIIDTESTVNYCQLYVQAVHELRHGVR